MLTCQGPDGKWFAVGLGGLSMSDQPYTIVVDGSGNLEERKIGDHYEGRHLDPSVAIVSNGVIDGRRTVVVTRSFQGITTDHYTFAAPYAGGSPGIEIISASGTGPDLAYHGPDQRSGETVVLTSLGASSTCVCRNGWKGTYSN